MFTGIIEGIGTVRAVSRRDITASFEIEADFGLEDTNVGDSISINGCCVTVTSRLGNRIWADLTDETLRTTSLGGLKVGDRLNMERALKVGGRLGGHIVQGHVDGVGKIKSFKEVSEGREIEVQIPDKLTRYVVEKGSMAIDGVSLTINKVVENSVYIRIIPHTIESTVLKFRKVGDPVNLEVDIIGKYVEKLHFLGSEEYHSKGKITEEFLKKHGF